jgi:hypothetical protein
MVPLVRPARTTQNHLGVSPRARAPCPIGMPHAVRAQLWRGDAVAPLFRSSRSCRGSNSVNHGVRPPECLGPGGGLASTRPVASRPTLRLARSGRKITLNHILPHKLLVLLHRFHDRLAFDPSGTSSNTSTGRGVASSSTSHLLNVTLQPSASNVSKKPAAGSLQFPVFGFDHYRSVSLIDGFEVLQGAVANRR